MGQGSAGSTASPAEQLLQHTHGHVRTLTINRPEARNALSPEVVCRLADAWQQAASDDEVRVVVLTGVGTAFSAGADLRLLVPLLTGALSPSDKWGERLLRDEGVLHRAVLRDRVCDKPIIAAVNGPATAGGLELMLGTDVRVAADTATFGLAEVRRGLMPGGGGVSRLPRQVPLAFALEMLLTGHPVPAGRAQANGLVNAVCRPSEVPERALEIAEAIAENGPFALAEILRAVRESEGLPLSSAMAVEAAAFGRVMRSADAVEGPAAFLERRPPRFIGR